MDEMDSGPIHTGPEKGPEYSISNVHLAVFENTIKWITRPQNISLFQRLGLGFTDHSPDLGRPYPQ